MKRIIILITLMYCIVVPVSGLEIEAPQVPESGSNWMPENRYSFGDALWELFQKGISFFAPEVKRASRLGARILCIVLLTSFLQSFSGPIKAVSNLAANIGISLTLLDSTGTMITMGMETVQEISDYGKLLFPVMTAAMAAQGGITTSASLYAGTAMFNTILNNIIISVLIPGIKVYLAVSIVNSVTNEDILRRIADCIKSSNTWILKTLLTVFTTYLSISSVVSGTTDAVTLKAAKVAISSVVPVVGGILSDASEAVLISVGIARNAAGIYGILAVIAVFLEPFLRIFSNYIILKTTGAVCSIFSGKTTTALNDAFSTAMGFLLAVMGGTCIMLLISTICFMRSVQ